MTGLGYDPYFSTGLAGYADDLPGDVYRTAEGRLNTVAESRQYLREQGQYKRNYLTYTTQQVRFGLDVGPVEPYYVPKAPFESQSYTPVFLMPTRMSQRFFETARVEPTEVTLYQDLYQARMGKEAPEAVKVMDRALSQPGLGERFNKLVGGTVYREGKGLLGSVMITLGRAIDQTVLGYDDFEKQVRRREGRYKGSLGKFLRGEPEFQPGPFESGAAYLYETGVATATAVGFYLGISLPLTYMFTRSIEELINESLDTTSIIDLQQPGAGRGLVHSITRHLVLGSENAQRFEEALRADLWRADPDFSYQTFPYLDNFNPDQVGAGAWLRTGINLGRRVSQSIFTGVMAPILRGMVSFDPSESANLERFELALSQFSEMLGKPMTIQYVEPSEYEEVEVISRKDGKIRVMKVANTLGQFIVSNISYEDRVEKLAKQMDEIAGFIPLNPLQWIPAVREVLGLPKPKAAETPMLVDLMSFEKIALWSKEFSRTLGQIGESIFYTPALQQAYTKVGKQLPGPPNVLASSWKLLRKLEKLRKMEDHIYKNLDVLIPDVDFGLRIKDISPEAYEMFTNFNKLNDEVIDLVAQLPRWSAHLSTGFVSTPPDAGVMKRQRVVKDIRGWLVTAGAFFLLDRFVDVSALGYRGISLSKQIAGMEAAREDRENVFDIVFRPVAEQYVSSGLGLIAGGLAGLAIPYIEGTDVQALLTAREVGKKFTDLTTDAELVRLGEEGNMEEVSKRVWATAKQVRKRISQRLLGGRKGGFNLGAALVGALVMSKGIDAWNWVRASLQNAQKPIWGGAEVEGTYAAVAARLEKLAVQTLTNPNATSGEIAEAAATVNLINSLYRTGSSMGEVINVATQVTTPIVQLAFTSQTRLQPGADARGWPVGVVTKMGVSLQLMPTSGLGLSISAPFKIVTRSTNAAHLAYNLQTWQDSSVVVGGLYSLKRFLDFTRLPWFNGARTIPTEQDYGGAPSPSLVYEPDTLLERAFLGTGAIALTAAAGRTLDKYFSKVGGAFGREYEYLRAITTPLMGGLRVAEFMTSAIVALPLQMLKTGVETVFDVSLNRIDLHTGQRTHYAHLDTINPNRSLEQAFHRLGVRAHHLPYLLSYILASSALDVDSGAINTEANLESRFYNPGQQLGAFTLTAMSALVLYKTGAGRHPTAIMSEYFHRIDGAEAQLERAAREIYESVGARERGFTFEDFFERFKRLRDKVITQYDKRAELVTSRRWLREMATDPIIEAMDMRRVVQVGEKQTIELSLGKTGISLRGRVKAAAVGYVAIHVGLNLLSQILPAETLYQIHRIPAFGSALEFITGVKPKKSLTNEYFYKTGFKGSQEQSGLVGTISSFLRMFTLGAFLPKEGLYSDEPDPFVSLGGRIGASFKGERAVIFMQTAGAAMDFSMSQYLGGGKAASPQALLAYYRTLTHILGAKSLPARIDRATYHNQINSYEYDAVGSNAALLRALTSRQYRLEHLRSQNPIDIRLGVMRELLLVDPVLRYRHPATRHLPYGANLLNLYLPGLLGQMTWHSWRELVEQHRPRMLVDTSMRGYHLLKDVQVSGEVKQGKMQSRGRSLEYMGIEAFRLVSPLSILSTAILLPGTAVGVLSTAAGIASYLRKQQKRSAGGFVEQVIELSPLAQGRTLIPDDSDSWYKVHGQSGGPEIVTESIGRRVVVASAEGLSMGTSGAELEMKDIRSSYLKKVNALFTVDAFSTSSRIGDLDKLLSDISTKGFVDFPTKVNEVAESLAKKFMKIINTAPVGGASNFGSFFFPELMKIVGEGQLSELSQEAAEAFEQQLKQDLVDAISSLATVELLEEYQEANERGKKAILAAVIDKALWKVKNKISYGSRSPSPDTPTSVQQLYTTAKKLQSDTESFLKSVVKGAIPASGLVFGYVVYGKELYTFLEGAGAILSAGKAGSYYGARSVASSITTTLSAEATIQVLRRIIPSQSTAIGNLLTIGSMVGINYFLDKFSRSRHGRWMRDMNEALLNQSTNLIYGAGRLVTGSLIGKSAFVGLAALAGYALAPGLGGALVGGALGAIAVEGTTFRMFDKYVGEPLFAWSLTHRLSSNPVHQILANFFIPTDRRWMELMNSRSPGPRSPFSDSVYWHTMNIEQQAKQRLDRALRSTSISDEWISSELQGRPSGFWHRLKWEAMTEGGQRPFSRFNPYRSYISRSQRMALKSSQDLINRLAARRLYPRILPNQAFLKLTGAGITQGLMFGISGVPGLQFSRVLSLYELENQTATDLNQQSYRDWYDPRDYLYRYRELKTYRWGMLFGGALGVVLPRGVSEMMGVWVAEQLANAGLFDQFAEDAYDTAPYQLVGRTDPGGIFYRMSAKSLIGTWFASRWEQFKTWAFSRKSGKLRPSNLFRGWVVKAASWLDNKLNGEVGENIFSRIAHGWANISVKKGGFWGKLKGGTIAVGKGIGWLSRQPGRFGNWLSKVGSSRWMAPGLMLAGTAVLTWGALQPENRGSFWKGAGAIVSSFAAWKTHSILRARFGWYGNLFKSSPLLRIGFHSLVAANLLIGTGALSWAGIKPGEPEVKSMLWGSLAFLGVAGGIRMAGRSRALMWGLAAGLLTAGMTHDKGRTTLYSTGATVGAMALTLALPKVIHHLKPVGSSVGQSLQGLIPADKRAELAKSAQEGLERFRITVPSVGRKISRHFWSLAGYAMSASAIVSSSFNMLRLNRAGGVRDALAYESILQLRASTRGLAASIFFGAWLGGWGEAIGGIGAGFADQADVEAVGALIYDAQQANIKSSTLWMQEMKQSYRTLKMSVLGAGLIRGYSVARKEAAIARQAAVSVDEANKLRKALNAKDWDKLPWHKVFRWAPKADDLVGQSVSAGGQAARAGSRVADVGGQAAAGAGWLGRSARAVGKLQFWMDVGIGAGITVSGIYKLATAKNKYERASGIRRTASGLVQTFMPFVAAPASLALAALLAPFFAAAAPIAFVAIAAISYIAMTQLAEHTTNVVVDHALENWVPSDQRVTSRYNRKAWKKQARSASRQSRPTSEYKLYSGRITPQGKKEFNQDRQKERSFPKEPDAKETYQGIVRQVIDGDTISMGRATILRLYSIDALELGQDKWGGSGMAKKAKEALSDLTKGRTVRYTPYGKLRGRMLVRIENDKGQDVEMEMIRQGLAFVRPELEQADPDLFHRYKRIEEEAKKEKRGVWSGVFEEEYGGIYPWEYRQGKRPQVKKKEEKEEIKSGRMGDDPKGVWGHITGFFTHISEFLFGKKAQAAVPPSALSSTATKTYTDTRMTGKLAGNVGGKLGSKENYLKRVNMWFKRQAKAFRDWITGVQASNERRRRREAQAVGILEGQEVSVHALVQDSLASMLGVGGRTTYSGQRFSRVKESAGLNVLVDELIRTAPQYFNTETAKGRAALLAAVLIAGGEITGELPKVASNKNILYNYMGGSGRRMRGWAQFETRYYHPYQPKNTQYYQTYDPVSYNVAVGKMLYGIYLSPDSKFRLNMDEFARLLDQGYFKSGEEVRAYLAKQLPFVEGRTGGKNWQGIVGSGADRLRSTGIQEEAFAIFASRQLAQVDSRKPPQLKAPSIDQIINLAGMIGKIAQDSSSIGSSDAGERIAREAKRQAGGRSQSTGRCLYYVANAIEQVYGRGYMGNIISAYEAAEVLESKKEFREVKGLSREDLKKLPPGAVIIWMPRGDNPRMPNSPTTSRSEWAPGASSFDATHGHISISIGRGWEASGHEQPINTASGGYRVFLPVGSDTKVEPGKGKPFSLKKGDYIGLGLQRYLEEQAEVVGGRPAMLLLRQEIEKYNASLPQEVRAAALGAQAKGIDPNNFVRPSGTVRMHDPYAQRTSETSSVGSYDPKLFSTKGLRKASSPNWGKVVHPTPRGVMIGIGHTSGGANPGGAKGEIEALRAVRREMQAMADRLGIVNIHWFADNQRRGNEADNFASHLEIFGQKAREMKYTAIELHYDQVGGQSGLIPRRGGIDPVEHSLSREFGSFGENYRGWLKGPKEGVSLLEFGAVDQADAKRDAFRFLRTLILHNPGLLRNAKGEAVTLEQLTSAVLPRESVQIGGFAGDAFTGQLLPKTGGSKPVNLPGIGRVIITNSFAEDAYGHGRKGVTKFLMEDGKLFVRPPGTHSHDVDLVPVDNMVRTFTSGRVIFNANAGSAGNMIILETNYKVNYQGREHTVYWHYMHLNNPARLEIGAQVKQGQIIGDTKALTGRGSGPHLGTAPYIEVNGERIMVHPNLVFRQMQAAQRNRSAITTTFTIQPASQPGQAPPGSRSTQPAQAPATGQTYFRMSPTGSLDNMGNIIMRVDVVNAEGKVVDSFNAIAGRPGKQNLRVDRDPQAKAGSEEPIPEGVYRVGKMETGLKDPVVGDVWIGLVNVLEGKKEKGKSLVNRSGFGIHLDLEYGKPGGHGSQGCVVVGTKQELQRIQNLYQRYRPAYFVVDYKKGSLPQQYQVPKPAKQENSSSQKLSQRLDNAPTPSEVLTRSLNEQRTYKLATEFLQFLKKRKEESRISSSDKVPWRKNPKVVQDSSVPVTFTDPGLVAKVQAQQEFALAEVAATGAEAIMAYIAPTSDLEGSKPMVKTVNPDPYKPPPNDLAEVPEDKFTELPTGEIAKNQYAAPVNDLPVDFSSLAMA